MKLFETDVIIVGAGPAGLAVSACLNRETISNILLEREDCFASLWRRSYDRLKLHLAKQICELPHMSFPPETPTFMSKADFIQYLELYVSRFGINPKYNINVESAKFDPQTQRWCVEARNSLSSEWEVYVGKFIVVASGENGEGFIPDVEGLSEFQGVYMHSSMYKNGEEFRGKNVIVVGVGNSGFEIAYDLSNYGAKTSIVCHGTVHVLTKELVYLGMALLKYLPLKVVDQVILRLSKLWLRDTSKYGLPRPADGPFYIKATNGRSPTIDVGALPKIQRGEIRVFPAISRINGNGIVFEDGRVHHFDAIIFATGYKRTFRNWLKGADDFFPTQFKENEIYFAGFGRNGLFGISKDARNIADDVSALLKNTDFQQI